MKKQILIVALAVVMVVCLVGCGTTYQEATGQTESNSSGDFGNGYLRSLLNGEMDITLFMRMIQK